MKELSIEDQIYLCKYHDVDTSLNFTMGINQEEINKTIDKLKANGLYEQYRNLDDSEYEKIIKSENQKSKFEKILDKYNFDKEKKTYQNFRELLTICGHYKSANELSLEKVYRKISDQKGVKSYIINNDCKRILDATYLENKEIFKANNYTKKPTVREFVLQELKIQDANNKGNASKEKEEYNDAPKKNVICDSTPNIGDIDNTFVKVPVKTMMECSYWKGYLDRILEEKEK